MMGRWEVVAIQRNFISLSVSRASAAGKSTESQLLESRAGTTPAATQARNLVLKAREVEEYDAGSGPGSG